MRYHLNISVAVGGAAPVEPLPAERARGRGVFHGIVTIFGRFPSTFVVFLSTFGMFLSTYSLVFPCISRIFFVSLQYSYKVSVMFDQDLFQDDYLEALDSLVEGLSGSLFRVCGDSVSDRLVR